MTGLTEQQLADHRSGIGSSDAAAVCGLNKWRSPVDVWMEKTGQQRSVTENMAMRCGTLMEPVVAQLFLDANPDRKIRRWGRAYRKHGFMVSHVDRIISDNKAILEIKTAGFHQASRWDDGLVPDEYLIQVHHQMICANRKHAYLAVLIGGNDYRQYHIPRDDGLCESLVVREREFWDHVENRTPPPIRDAGDVRTLFPRGEGMIYADDYIRGQVEEYRSASDDLKQAQNRKDMAGDEIRKFMEGAAELVNDADGQVLVTWNQTKPIRKVSWKTIVEDVGISKETIAQYTTENPGSRVLRVRAQK